MMQFLNSLPADHQPEGLPSDDADLAGKLSQRYAGIKDYKVMGLSAGDSRKVSQFHNMLKKKAGPQVKGLQNTSINGQGVNFIQMLKDVASEADFDTTYFDMEDKTLTGEFQCLLQLATLPVAVCYGTGGSKEEAQSTAAHNALEYLKIMTKPKTGRH